MQDGFEIGHTRATAERAVMVALRSPVERWQGRVTEEKLGMSVFQVGEQVPNTNTTLAFGNLEVTPPLGDDILGRVYFSEPSREDLKDFLRAQRVQRPFSLDASWLRVGHADEVVCFLPLPDRRALALVPSPRLAYRLIYETLLQHPGATILTDREIKLADGTRQAGQSLVDFLAAPIAPGADFINLGVDFELEESEDPRARYESVLTSTQQGEGEFDSKSAQAKLLGVIQRIRDEFPESQVVIEEVPVLFFQAMMKLEALTADIVNMLVLSNRCLFPKPYGPVTPGPIQIPITEPFTVEANADVFEAYTLSVLGRYGFTGTSVDTWAYHMDHGEIHCATNVRRKPSQGSYWWLRTGQD